MLITSFNSFILIYFQAFVWLTVPSETFKWYVCVCVSLRSQLPFSCLRRCQVFQFQAISMLPVHSLSILPVLHSIPVGIQWALSVHRPLIHFLTKCQLPVRFHRPFRFRRHLRPTVVASWDQFPGQNIPCHHCPHRLYRCLPWHP